MAGAAIGSYYDALPPECVVEGDYYRCGEVWYQPAFRGDEITYVAVRSGE
jgi:hypothetical protein